MSTISLSSSQSLNVVEGVVGENEVVYSVDMAPVIGDTSQITSIMDVDVHEDSGIMVSGSTFVGSVVFIILDLTNAVARNEPWCIKLLIGDNNTPIRTLGALLLLRILSCESITENTESVCC